MSTCDHSTTYRLNIHKEEHHFREDRPDNKTSGEGPVEEMMTATMMSMNDNVETSEERESVGRCLGTRVLSCMPRATSTWTS